MAAYHYDESRLNIAGGNGAAAGCPTDLTNTFNDVSCTWFSETKQHYHTFIAAADVNVIPGKFDLRFEGLYTIAKEASWLTACAAGNGCNGLTGLDPTQENFGQYPTQTNTYQQYKVTGRYRVDPSLVQQMGWTGDVVIKGRYSFVRNNVSSYSINDLTPYVSTADASLEGGSRSLFLAGINSNYSAHIVALAVAIKW
jgi:hypothetical protein